jgi:ATP-dependent exoDNAse (exonuclease V) beta subunit
VPTFYPTQIQTYLQCPRKYHFGRDRELKAKYAKASPHMVLGNAAHDALQVFFDVTKVKPGERTVEKLHELFRDAWAGRNHFSRNRWKQKEAREQAFGGDTATEAAWGKKGLDMLWRFVQTADLAAQPLTAEQFHEIWLTEHVTLGGKIDRIDRREDGALLVLDYKTGKPPRTPRAAGDEAPKAPAAGDAVRRSSRPLGQDDLQLAAYALLVTRKFRGRVARCTYVYLNDDLDLFFEPTEDQLRAKEAEIVGICTRILDDKSFGATPNVLCPWCEYRPICPEGEAWVKAHEGGGAPPEDVPF